MRLKPRSRLYDLSYLWDVKLKHTHMILGHKTLTCTYGLNRNYLINRHMQLKSIHHGFTNSSSQIKICDVFSYLCSKHRSWILPRPALLRRFYKAPTIYVLSKNKKNNVYPCKLQFSPYKVKFTGGCSLHGLVKVMWRKRTHKKK